MPTILDDLNPTPIDALDGAENDCYGRCCRSSKVVAVERFQCADMPPGAFEAERFQIDMTAGHY